MKNCQSGFDSFRADKKHRNLFIEFSVLFYGI